MFHVPMWGSAQNYMVARCEIVCVFVLFFNLKSFAAYGRDMARPPHIMANAINGRIVKPIYQFAI